LILVALASGTLAGLHGPRIVRAVRERWTAPKTVLKSGSVPTNARLREWEESSGYFESAETPLR
jgi:hypothetical protein